MSEETQRLYAQTVALKAEELIAKYPHITRLPLFYGGFLQNTGNHEKAKTFLEQALETSPDKIQIHWVLAQNALALGDNESALRYVEQAAELAPEYDLAQQNLNQIRQQLGQ